jgi:hypothetical protein
MSRTSDVDSFFGTLFSPSLSPSTIDTSTSISVSKHSNENNDSWSFSFNRRTLLILASIAVFFLLIWIYRRYSNRIRYNLPKHVRKQQEEFIEKEPEDNILTEDMIIDAERSSVPGPSLPSFPPAVHQTPPSSTNPLIQLEQQLTKTYSEFQEAIKQQDPDIRALKTWESTMATLLAKMKEHIIPVLKSEQASNSLKQQLQGGLQDAEVIVTTAHNQVEELKRIQSATENEKETSGVVRNMHYLGYGNKIKKAKIQSL